MKNEEILDSWKAISNYLDRDIKTCSRWEKKLGLPVHRIDNHSSRSKVFAYKSEIDQWLKEKSNFKEIKKKSFLENRWAIIGLLSISILLAIIFAFLFFKNGISTSSLSDNLSIAVFPFENLNSSEYDEYFSEGITNEIINNITKLGKLKVMPVNSVAKYKNTTKDTKQIGKELSTAYILKGKIEKEDNKIRMSVQLIRTKGNKNIWSAEYDGKLEDIFLIQENICQKINETLNINMDQKLPLSSNYGKTQDYVAFDNYLKGNYILNRKNENNNDPWKLYHQGKYYGGKFAQESNELAIILFNQAIKIDSHFALAYIGLSQCYVHYVNFDGDYDKKWLDKAEDLIKKAQTISPYLPEYYSTLIEIYLLKELYFNENTKSVAFELAQEGIKKYPDHPQLNSIIGYCYYAKFGEEGNEADFDKALEYKEKSFWLNPYTLNNIVYVELLMLNKEFYKAIEVCNIIEKRDTSSFTKFRLGEIYYYLGDLDKSESIFQQFDDAPLKLKIDPLFNLAMIASQLGEKERALRIIKEIKRISPEEFIVDGCLNFASTYMGMEMEELGYKYLSSFFDSTFAKKTHFIYLKYIDIDKNFDKYKEEEKFKKITKNKG